MIKAALVIEGGSYRGLFAAGVLDVFMENDIWFEYANGVSSGGLILYNYLSKQPYRTRDINETFCNDKRYVGMGNLLRDGNVFNFRFMRKDICEELFPMDMDTFNSNPMETEVAATNCVTGKPEYFSKKKLTAMQYDIACMASASMPILSKIVLIDRKPYLDGGVSCPIAYNRAFEVGYDKVVVISSRPYGYRCEKQSHLVQKCIERKYARFPKFCEQYSKMAKIHNEQYEELEKLEDEGKVYVLRPSGTIKVGHLERSAKKIEELYQEGVERMNTQMDDLKKYLEI